MINFALLVVPALLMDHLFGELSRFHPLVGFGRWAVWMESHFYGPQSVAARYRKMRGLFALLLLLGLPILLCVGLTAVGGWVGVGVHVVILYLAIGGRSLLEHGMAVLHAMAGEGLEAACQKVGYLVSRETAQMDESAVARGAVESVLENGCDAIFGAIFWFLLLGAPGALFYRLANTLDALWGYKNERYLHFGWAAARLDDLLNLIPARLTAITYLLVGQSGGAWRAWRGCRHRKSPNATLVMAVGAGALGIQLGGEAVYQGCTVQSPPLGEGPVPTMQDIPRAIFLLRRGLLVWAVISLLLGVLVLA